MVYTALQLVSRGRGNGISVVDLSKKTGYDPKTCHYLVNKLLELNYIEKRKKSGVGANFCIHKYFFGRSAAWKEVLAEEAGAIDLLKVELEEEADLDGEGSTQTPNPSALSFDPIDQKHLSSLPVVRGRIVKLLKNSPNNLHAMHNLLVTIGFQTPTKTDRRFFATRLRELMAEGIIEKVQTPHPKRKNAVVACIQLRSPSEGFDDQVQDSLDPQLTEEEDSPKLIGNVTLHKQILDLVHASGTTGVTLNVKFDLT